MSDREAAEQRLMVLVRELHGLGYMHVSQNESKLEFEAVRDAYRDALIAELEWADDQLPPIVDGRGVIRRRIDELRERRG